MRRIDQKGQLLILAMIVLTLVLINSILIISKALTFSQSSKYSVEELQAINLAEAGIDKAVASLNKSSGSYNGEQEISLGNGTYEVQITNVNSSTKLIESTGYIPSKESAKIKRAIKIQVSKGEGVSFSYGIQVGEGGLSMSNNSQVRGIGGTVGNVYANGNIDMSNGAKITGDAYVASGTNPVANQETECSDPNCIDSLFGKNISGENRFDIAQSFTPSVQSNINKIAIRIKKMGSGTYPDLPVRILSDNSGSPSKNNPLAIGTLYASLVTGEYNFVDVAFTSSPTLTAGTKYWILVDTCGNNTDCGNASAYWSWSLNSLPAYAQGESKWSIRWNPNGTPVWNGPLSHDLAFKVFMGGIPTHIQGTNGSIIEGEALANTLNNLTINKEAFYQIQNSIVVSGQNCDNPSSNLKCHPGSADPLPRVMPISDGNIQEWKDAAALGGQQGLIDGCLQALGPKKINGSVKLTNNCNMTVTAPIWITGDLELDNGAIMKLDPSVGGASGVIVVNGKIKLSNNGRLQGSGSEGSYLMGLSTYDSRSDGVIAIEADNGSDSSILYANNGIVFLKNNAKIQEVTGWKISLDNNAIVEYEAGLTDQFFTSGPSGSYSVIKGTYQTK